jgi:hypothetical protein
MSLGRIGCLRGGLLLPLLLLRFDTEFEFEFGCDGRGVLVTGGVGNDRSSFILRAILSFVVLFLL